MPEKPFNPNLSDQIDCLEAIKSIENRISIDKNSEFFIALCQRGSHSYIMLGVKDPSDSQPRLLASIGKFASRSQFFGIETNMLRALVWDTPARIRDEDQVREVNQANHISHFEVDYNKEGTPVLRRSQGGSFIASYKAYSLTYRQYLEFLYYLKALTIYQQAQIKASKGVLTQKLQENFQLHAYCPISENEREVILEWQAVQDLPQNPEFDIDPLDKRISIFFNSCRHTALRLLNAATGIANFKSGLSSFWNSKPPYMGYFQNGRVCQDFNYFYILPLPPQAYTMEDPDAQLILQRLYQRIEEVISSQSRNPKTFEKFKSLKALYQELAGQCDASILDVIRHIEKWENEHAQLIKAHRKKHWFTFKTATEKMFIRLHKEFDEIKAELEPEDSPFNLD